MATTIKQIEEALRQSGGFISPAARMLGVTPTAVRLRINKSERLQLAKKDAIETMLDLAESELIKNIKNGKEASIFFALKCLGKERGYIEKQEVTHSVDDGARLLKAISEKLPN